MATIFKVKYNAYGIEMFKDTSPEIEGWTGWTFEVRDRYYEVIEEREVPVKIQFCSSYRGEFHYEFFDKTFTEYNKDGEMRRIALRIHREEWSNIWNYTKEDFEREVNGALMIPHMMCGEALRPEIFEIMQLLHPDVIRGHFNHETKCWMFD